MADNPQVNQPASGDYGEKADLTRLKKSLPQGSPVVGQPAAPAPPIGQQTSMVAPAQLGRPNTTAAVPPGVPSVIAAPTQRPDVPVSTPLAAPPPSPMAGAATPDQGRLALLQMLAEGGSSVTPETQEWAQNVLHILLGGQGQVIGG